MLGYFVATGRGESDGLLRAVAEALQAEDLPLAGAVQVNVERGAGRKCHMDLHILGGSDVVRISQDLGPHSSGCRLDPAGLEQAVGLVSAALGRGARLLVVNKFGKHELNGRGFCPVIGEAMAAEIPALIAVSQSNLSAFQAWAGALGAHLAPTVPALVAWAREQAAMVPAQG